MSNKKTKAVLALTTLAMSVALSACGHEHEWVRATCTEPRMCVTCGEIKGDALGHDWLDDGFCFRCGATNGERVVIEEPIAEPSLYERFGGRLYIGDEFTLGTYEQDNDLENGAEDIEWIVYAKEEDGTYLCISKYVLDFQQFNDYYRKKICNKWQKSTLRTWLNETFYEAAFSEEDLKNLVEMNTSYYTWSALTDIKKYRDNAKDMVRLLNYGEMESPECVQVTEYARAQADKRGNHYDRTGYLNDVYPLYVNDGTREHDGDCFVWWLMSYDVEEVDSSLKRNNLSCEEAHLISKVAVFDHRYYDKYTGREADCNLYAGVRPVICVKLEKN